MKRIILVSTYIIASIAMISCSNDEVETPAKTVMKPATQEVHADGVVGQGGQVLPPKP